MNLHNFAPEVNFFFEFCVAWFCELLKMRMQVIYVKHLFLCALATVPQCNCENANSDYRFPVWNLIGKKVLSITFSRDICFLTFSRNEPTNTTKMLLWEILGC